jgi:hypothetical protein
MKALICVGAVIFGLSAMAGEAGAKGCIKGAIVGGVAGHYAGHHTVLGAAAGCVVGHHRASRQVHQQQPRTNQGDHS